MTRAASPDPFLYPPRGMEKAEAARYLGIGTTKFDELVGRGVLPKPKRIDGAVRWDRIALDLAFGDLPEDRPNAIDAARARA